ncbi:thioredoxin [Volvox carteri f. nagariensis]|uniref:Thioredoxin n=1 Tax=Volvox carteri f. nagariensis TaxID=3068 RepID=D8U7B7_VOLCA|nr:thioredoxin [Volvox carteri f. nagariensis]EFJ44458.1 thioredoxin [Volvox carteri f. nagariensis]|eukprot:XP_002954565.1 thioredoxin [Volvox carteri f. nagariensis]
MEALHARSFASLGQCQWRARPLAAMPHRRASHVVLSLNSGVVAAATVAGATLPLGTATATPVKTERAVCELDPKSFYDFISCDDLCVVDYYTDWCGPCQVMHKELDKMTAAFKGVKFAKLNCGNCQDFSTRQRIRALPTFRLYYKGTCLDEVTGAKPMQLRQLLTHYLCMTTIAP